MTYKFKLNKYHESYCFIWDDKYETVIELDKYLKEVKGKEYSAIRSYNEKTGLNDGDVLCIVKDEGFARSSSYYYKGNCLLDVGKDYFRKYDNVEYLKADNIELVEI
jgi:hypothetical protein